MNRKDLVKQLEEARSEWEVNPCPASWDAYQNAQHALELSDCARNKRLLRRTWNDLDTL